jgi:hypothetical protein
MRNFRTKEFIKLGTSLRYLIDSKGYPTDSDGNKIDAKECPRSIDECNMLKGNWNRLSGRHVIDNIRVVLELIPSLEFAGTEDSGAYTRLSSLQEELKAASETRTELKAEEAERLETYCRRLRTSILAEGEKKEVFYMTQEEVRRAEGRGWPSELNVDLLLNTPYKIVASYVGTVSAAFLVGVGAAQSQPVTRIIEFLKGLLAG